MYKIKDVDDLRRVIAEIGDGMAQGDLVVVMLAPVYGGMVRNSDYGNAATLKKTAGGVEIWQYSRAVTVNEYWSVIRRNFLQKYIDCDGMILDVALRL